MTIRDYIRDEVFGRRAHEAGCLVVYDPARRFREVVAGMASDRCRVIDTLNSVVEQREAATEAYGFLAAGKIGQLIIWVPAPRPIDAEARQRDPFSVFGLTGSEFPAGDGDDFASICRRAKPDHVSEINRLFEQGTPDFTVIDALDQGGSWPTLKTLLDAGSPREILLGILAPSESQEIALKTDRNWAPEAREFIDRTLGLRLRTQGSTRAAMAEELWRAVLFSEFAFDSGSHLPASLEAVPRIGEGSRSIVFEVCDALRGHDNYKNTYVTKASVIEAELALPERCRELKYLGERDTFAFEERFYLAAFVEAALRGDSDRAREIHDRRQKSIWLAADQSRLAEWWLAVRALDLLETAVRLGTPKFGSLESIVHGYASTWRELDRHHRQLEQAANEQTDYARELDDLVARSRQQYFRTVEALQAEFLRLVRREGWPATGSQLLWNRQVFTKQVAPALEDGESVAYFLVDSLRYELGLELQKQLSDRHKVSLSTVCAQLPTYTEVGMASLMPEAETALRLSAKDGTLVSTLAGQPASTPAARFAYLQSRKGDQCTDIDLEELVRNRRPKIPEKTKLLVVRTHDIDAIAHSSPRQVLRIIPELVRQILRGISRVAELGFDRAVIATDHGFLLFGDQNAGDVASRPRGRWLVEKSRCQLGTGQEDDITAVFKRTDVGIEGDFEDYAVPKTLVPYLRGQLYYHEGLSLQECVLPCLTVSLSAGRAQERTSSLPNLTLSYKQGKTDRISSRRPVVDLSWPEAEFFAEESETEVGIEAVDSKGEAVGRLGASQAANDATGAVRIRPGAAVAVGLKMEESFSGTFTVRVFDLKTHATLADLKLKTDYLE